MTEQELKDLEEKAKAATHGHWKMEYEPDEFDSLDEPTIKTCKFIIAANPHTVLALIAEIRRLRKENGE